MCMNIRKKMPPGSTLYINDVYTPACDKFKADYSSFGPIEIVSTAREAAEQAGIIISIVPAGKDVKAVYLDEKTGVIAARKNGHRLMLECSTIDVASTKEVGSRLAKEGSGTYIDAPVSGGVPAAEQGTLAMLIGHKQPTDTTPASQRLSAVLSMLGAPSKFFYLNELGAGLTAKIANNYLSGTILLATAEALAMGVKHGLDPSDLYSVIKHSTGQSWMCDHVMPIPNVQTDYWVPSNSGYRPGFKTQMMLKDLGLGIEGARQVGIEPSMALAAMKVWESATKDARCIDRDGSSVYLHVGGVLPQGYEDKGRRNEDGTWDF
ncbi:6-phosphogluconate dehydrogenase [Paraphoma chrysanthemicola]|nr:6-phosphogluconate dehydrogenase [Paraphoma chrysanthemicola]